MAKFFHADSCCMMEMWGICVLCERSVFDNNGTHMNYTFHRSCGCLVHAEEKCPFPKVRPSHASMHNGYQINRNPNQYIVEGFVRKTFPFETVESAFTKYLAKKSPYLQDIVHKAGLENKHLEEIAALKLELEEVRTDSNDKLVLAEQKADEATNRLAVMTAEIEKMKKEWSELNGKDFGEDSKTTKMTEYEYSPAINDDEHVLDAEWDNFKRKFTEVHEAVQTLLQTSVATRNSSLINSTVKKVDSATAVTNEARTSVVEVLKRETEKLMELSISNDVVESGNKDDAKLLD